MASETLKQKIHNTRSKQATSMIVKILLMSLMELAISSMLSLSAENLTDTQ